MPAATPKPWIQVKADGVTVFSNGSPKDATEVVVNYLAYRDALRRLLASVDHTLDPTVLMVFKTRAELRSIRSDTSKYANDVALSTQIDGEAFTAFSLEGDRSDALRVALEFDALCTLPRITPALPFWMQQGFASTLSTLQTDEDTYTVGRSVTALRTAMKKEKWLPWPEVSEMRSNSVAYHTPTSFQIFAAQSWGLVRMAMLTNPDQARDRFSSLLAEFRQSGQADQAVAKVLGLEPAAFPTALKWHVHKTSSLVIPFDTAAARLSVNVTPATDWEVALFHARLMQGFSRFDAAELELAKAMSQAPQRPAVLGAMGYQRLRLSDRNRGIEYYRAAIAAGASNPNYFLISAQARLDDAKGHGGDQPGQGGNSAIEAANEIRQALALSPGNGDAYRLLGRAFFVAEKIGQSEIDELAPGLVPSQHRGWTRYYRALLRQRLDQHAAGLEDIRSIMSDTSLPPKDRNAMLQSFADLHCAGVTKRVERLVQAGEFQAALTLVDDMLDPVVWTIVQEQRRKLQEWVEAQRALRNVVELPRR